MKIVKKENICIIPARGGSKRIPKKNMKYFFGKPIIYHVVEKIKKTNFFDKVVVSTESLEIAKYANKLGVNVHIRSKNLAKDSTKLKDVIINVINDYEKKNFYYKRVCCLFPTSIFFKTSELKLGFKKLKKNINFIFTAKKYDHPIERSFKKKRKSFSNVEPKNGKKKYTTISSLLS